MSDVKKKKGFTLTELIIVIVIIGILAAVLIPSLTGYINKAKKSAAEQDALAIYNEFISQVDNENYTKVSRLTYVIKQDKFYVIIEKGGLGESYDDVEELEKKLELNTKIPSGRDSVSELLTTLIDNEFDEDTNVVYLLKDRSDTISGDVWAKVD